jgi:transposase
METKETTITYSDRTSNQQPFDKRLIAHIVSLSEQGVPRKALVEQFGMTKGTLCEWLKNHDSAKIRKSYPVSHKRSVVRAVASGMSIKQAAVAFNISSGSIIRKWIADFKEDNSEISIPKPLEMANKNAEHPESAG